MSLQLRTYTTSQASLAKLYAISIVCWPFLELDGFRVIILSSSVTVSQSEHAAPRPCIGQEEVANEEVDASGESTSVMRSSPIRGTGIQGPFKSVKQRTDIESSLKVKGMSPLSS
ncbi:hypothetical protein NDA13_001912 [Ustilago tritici]|nr:hypothetical protein NDA13_001912 [Ustilago tritici]